MHGFYVIVGPSGVLTSMRMTLSSLGLPVVRAARAAPTAKLPCALRAFQYHALGAPQRSSGLQFIRQHFTASVRPVEMRHGATWGVSARSALGLGAAIGSIGYLCGGDAPGGTTIALATAMLLNLSILIHEAGHLAAARAMGVAVREFSVGIGPRVAWWQGPTTTYCLRAVPLLGFVSFLTSAQVARVAAEAGGGAAHGAMYGSHAAAQAPPRLLESLPPGRRAVVMAAGVVANVVLAAAFAAWQVLSYGEIGRVVRPGARIHRVDGWTSSEDDDATVEQQQQQQEAGGGGGGGRLHRSLRLQAGDVVLSVGRWRLPAGEGVEHAFVSALRAAAVEPPAAAADCDATSPECEQALAQDGAVQSLTGVKMAVQRTCRGGGLVPSRTILHLDAADVLRYDTLQVTSNLRVGVRGPVDWCEAMQMTGRELASWTSRIVGSWRRLLTGGGGSDGNSGIADSSSSTDSSSSKSGSSSGPGGGARFVGPLGLIASVASYMAEYDTDLQAQLGSGSSKSGSSSGYSCSASNSSGSDQATDASGTSKSRLDGGGGSFGGGCGDAEPSDDGQELLDESVVLQPHPLLGLGVQLNLQLAMFNLLPVPALDGGQLVLVALEALRGGRRLAPALERTALLGSALLLGGWLAALSVRDVVGLADRTAVRLAAAAEPYYGAYGTAGHGSDGGDGGGTDTELSGSAAATVTTASLAI